MALEPLKFGMVTGRLVATIADSAGDMDRDPDVQPLTGGVTFTPAASALLLPGALPDPATALPMPITATLDDKGYLSHSGVRGVRLVASVNNATNPSDFTYKVSFSLKLGTLSVQYPAFDITVPADGVVDLTTVAPVPRATGTPMIQGVGIADVQIRNGEFVFVLTDGSERNAGLVPISDSVNLGDYVRLEDLTSFATRDELDTYISEDEIFDKADRSELSSYAKVEALDLKADKTELDDVVRAADLADYARSAELESFATQEALQLKADKSELAEYAKATALDSKADKTALSGYATTTALAGKADKTELSSYAKTTALAGKADTAHQHSAADLTAGVVDAARLPEATQASAGAMSAADKTRFDKATSDLNKGELVARDAQGRANFAHPIDEYNAATKGYADATSKAVGDQVTALAQQIPTKTDGYSGVFKDSAGAVAFGIRDNGDAELHGAALERLPDTSNYVYGVADKLGRVAFGVRGDGTVEIEGQPARGKTTKRSPISLTLSDGSGTETRSSVHVRYPFAPTVNATLKAVHIRNIKDRYGTVYTGALSFVGAWLGGHNVTSAGLTGEFESAPQQLSGAFVTEANGNEYVIKGLDVPLVGNKDYMLSFGYTCATGQVNCSNISTTWATTTPGDASALAPAGMVKAATGPLDVWLEIEHTAPVGAYLGDSIWCGAGNTNPVYTAPGVLHARANGIVPMLYCHSGSMMTGWGGAASQYKFAKWAGLSKPEYVVWELGRNDLIDSPDVATMRTRFDNLYPVIKSVISPNVYMTTVTPKIDDETSTDGVVRRAWNDVIRKELSGGPVRMAFDAARAVERSGGTNMDAEVNRDGLHFNTYGSVKLAQSINQPLA